MTQTIDSIPEASAVVSAATTAPPQTVALPSLGREAAIGLYPWKGFKLLWGQFLGVFVPVMRAVASEFPALAARAGVPLPEDEPQAPESDSPEEEDGRSSIERAFAILTRLLPELAELPGFIDNLIVGSGAVSPDELDRLSVRETTQLTSACLYSLAVALAEVRDFLPAGLRAAASAWNDAASKAPSNTNSAADKD